MNDRVIPNLPPVLKSRFAGLTLLARQTQTDVELLLAQPAFVLGFDPGRPVLSEVEKVAMAKKVFLSADCENYATFAGNIPIIGVKGVVLFGLLF